MKKAVKIFGITLFVVLHCFAMAVVYAGFINSASTISSRLHPEKESHYFAVSLNLFCHPSLPESSTNTFNNSQAPTFECSINKFLAIVKSAEQLFANQFTQYIPISKNFLIRFRKTDLIFPFHYFW